MRRRRLVLLLCLACGGGPAAPAPRPVALLCGVARDTFTIWIDTTAYLEILTRCHPVRR